MSRWIRRIAAVIIWTVLGFGLGLLASITVPYLFGYRSMTVLSGSMEPTIHVGDVVVEQKVSPLDIRVGDIVTFRDPTDPSRYITHRVRSMTVTDTSVQFVTKGDANTSEEHWQITPDGTLGLVRYHVWRLGYLLFWIRGPLGRLLLVVIPALALGAYELARIWRPQPAEDDAVPEGEEEPGEAAA